MTARRVQSLHHNLGDKNVVFHREHRSKKNRKKYAKDMDAQNRKRKIEALRLKELEKGY